MNINFEFEHQVADYFSKLGYNTDLTRAVGDWGVDVFIEKEGSKGVVQVKNYGNSRTKVSRKDLMELYGVMAYFDCTFAKLVYNGAMNDDAKQVAEKLNIECIYMEYKNDIPDELNGNGLESFDKCWEKYVIPLQDTEINTISNQKYNIGKVDHSTLIYTNTKGKTNKSKIEVFRWAYNRIIRTGSVFGKDIRDEFKCPYSSLVVAVFMHIPYFIVEKGPYIKLKEDFSQYKE